MIMKTSFAKNVRLVIIKIIVTVAIFKLPNCLNYEYSSEKIITYLHLLMIDKNIPISKKESRF
jgi:hypothetical protein